jgi:predicted RNA binding protein YcfA (HicA-like mRNA interferase family)
MPLRMNPQARRATCVSDSCRDGASFAVFDSFLRRLGFTEGTVPGSHVYYEHPQSGTVIMARLHKPKDPVPWHTFASTRKILIERDVVTPQEFEQMTDGAVV